MNLINIGAAKVKKEAKEVLQSSYTSFVKFVFVLLHMFVLH